jgi:hypothetical protein
MRKTGRYIVPAVLVALVVAGLVVWWSGYGESVRWGRGPLMVSERAYYEARVKRIVNLWQEMSCLAPHDEQWRFVPPYQTYLVIDLRRRALWIEDQGQMMEETHCGLPAQMTWEAHLVDPNGPRKLGDLVRLQCRGIRPDRWRHELLFLVGSSQTNEYYAFDFDSVSHPEIRYGTGPYTFAGMAPLQKNSMDCFDSMLVDDAEYEQVRRTAPGAPQESAARQHAAEVCARMAPWLAVEKKLCQTMENKVMGAGFDLRGLTVEPGPDYSAGHADMRATRDGFLQRLFHRVSRAETYLRIDHLGEGVWYVHSAGITAKRPASPRAGGRQLQFEFVVSAGKSLSRAEQRKWISKGREYRKDRLQVPARWRIELANGTIIELVGIHDHLSEAKPWWGPDGTLLERAPYVPVKQFAVRPPEPTFYEIIWRAQLPPGAPVPEMNVELDSRASSRDRLIPIRDHRYGDREVDQPADNLMISACPFGKKSQEKTTLSLSIDFGGQGLTTIRFENVSLVPNKDFGFRIEAAK